MDLLYDIDDHSGIFRPAGSGRQNDMVGLKRPDLLCRHFIVSDDFYFRIDLSDELIEVIGKTVIIVDQQNHTDPSSHSKINPSSNFKRIIIHPLLQALML